MVDILAGNLSDNEESRVLQENTPGLLGDYILWKMDAD